MIMARRMTITVTRTTPGMPTVTSQRPAPSRAELSLAAERLRAPASKANIARNARAEVGRHARWAPMREAVWELVEPLLGHGARVAIVGAGNGDTVPIERIAAAAGELALIDLDGPAIRNGRRRQSRRLRRRIHVVEHDVTCGAADAIAAAAANGEVPNGPTILQSPLPGAPYDLVIGDLFYSQLLYPALVDLEVPVARMAAFLERYGPMLTRSVVSRLHVSAGDGPGAAHPRSDRVVARTHAAGHPGADRGDRRARPRGRAIARRPRQRTAPQRSAHRDSSPFASDHGHRALALAVRS
jgi:hypothetical protein